MNDPHLDAPRQARHPAAPLPDGDALAFLRCAFEATRSAILCCDTDGTIRAVNEAFTAITGYRPDEVVGRTPKVLSSGLHTADFYAAMWAQLEDEGRWEGEVWDRRASGEIFPARLTIRAVTTVAGRVGFVATIEDRSQSLREAHQATDRRGRDPVTGLLTRQRFLSLLEPRLGETQPIAVLALGVDDLGALHDTWGHDAGDEALRAVADRLRRRFGGDALVAWLGADRFAVALFWALDEAHLEDIARDARAMLAWPLAAGAHEVVLRATAGAAVQWGPGSDGDTLLESALMALARARAAGTGYLCYDDSMGAAARVNLDLRGRLARAFERGQLTLHYQPIVALPSERPVGVEALARWHDDGIWIAPGLFIPIAEESGLMPQLGEWVLRTACDQVARWRAEGTDVGYVSVNVSPTQLVAPGLADQVIAALTETGLPPGCLLLEVTEGALADGHDGTRAELGVLRARGVRVAIDDFGTGYSSLARLRSLPVDVLKIDRVFIANDHDEAEARAVIRAIAGLGSSLGMTVVGEGIETEAQRDIAYREGCDAAQGFLYARPLDAAELAAWWARARARAEAAAEAAPRFAWSPALELPAPGLNDEHRHLIDLVNRVRDTDEDDAEALGQALMGLLRHVTTHFDHEEELMAAHAYPRLPAHRALHRRFYAEVEAEVQRYFAGEPLHKPTLVELCESWTVAHICGADLAFAEWAKARS